MDYCLGPGDGTAHLWSGHPDVDVDGDGELDGVRLDIDGDGAFDDALTDLDDDGLADHAVLGLDDEGTAQTMFTDDGSGTWALTGGAPPGPLRWFGLDGVEHIASGPIDFDGDGRQDRLLDVDRDGLADRALRAAADGGFGAGYVDTDGDGLWDVALSDADGDGAADGASYL